MGSGMQFPYKKYSSACQKSLKKTLWSTKILCCGSGLKCFSSLKRYPFLHNTLSPVIFVSLSTLKGIGKGSAVDMVDLVNPSKLCLKVIFMTCSWCSWCSVGKSEKSIASYNWFWFITFDWMIKCHNLSKPIMWCGNPQPITFQQSNENCSKIQVERPFHTGN